MSETNSGAPGGWIKLYRVSVDKGWLHNQKLWTVWTYCLLKASHKEHKQMVGRQEVRLLPGQFIFGRYEAARELHMKPITLYKVMRRLERGQNLNIKSNNKFSLITVVNWELYQGKQDEEEHQKEHVGNTKGTPKEHKQEGKKGKRVLSSKDDLSPEGSGNGHCPHQDIIQLYHKTLPMLTHVRDWHEGRQEQLRARWTEDPERQDLEWWQSFFDYVKSCPHLIGENDRGWKPNLEWLVERKNFVKIIEGNYEARKQKMVRR